jgi:hypothetical protein
MQDHLTSEKDYEPRQSLFSKVPVCGRDRINAVLILARITCFCQKICVPDGMSGKRKSIDKMGSFVVEAAAC